MLKGTTKIELTNVKTGEREVIEKDNLVTNAVSDILSKNPYGFWHTSIMDANAYWLPVTPNLIGGILVFEKQIMEDASKYYVGEENKCIGYSSNNVNTTEDIKRGSMNQTESGPLEDGSGYKFVFDFATSQANGQISALGLTSKWGGVGFAGSEVNVENAFYRIFRRSVQDVGDSSAWEAELHQKFLFVVSVDEDKDELLSAWVSGGKTIKISRLRFPGKSIRLRETLALSTENIVSTETIETTNFAAESDSVRYYSILDGGDGYIWGFQHKGNAKGNSSGNAEINWIKISKTDFSKEEGSWTIPAQIFMLGEYNMAFAQYAQRLINYSLVMGGFLYCVKYDQKAIYKIEIANPSNISELKMPDGSTVDIEIARSYHVSGNTYRYHYTGTLFNTIGGTILFKNGVIEDGEISLRKATYEGSGSSVNYQTAIQECAKPGLMYGPYMLTFEKDGTAVNYGVVLPAPYLATINNLPSPVQKTADKTMKITYILREEME